MLITKKIGLILVAFILFGFLASGVFAGTTGKISGVIVDAKTGEPLPGAVVQLEGTSIGAQTNLDGEYVILNIPPKEYTAKIRLVGYKTQIRPGVKITSDMTFALNAELEETVIEGEEQVVMAEKDEIRIDDVQNLRIMTSDEIAEMPVQDVNQILAVQVGVVTRGGEIHVRGGRSGEVSYIVDGVETRDPLGGLGATDIGINLTSNALQEVQIIKGGFDAEYGNVLSGAIRIVTREGNVQLTSGRFEFWSDNFRIPELNDYSRNYDRISFNISGPDPIFSQRLFPALGLDYFEDKVAYFINVDVSKYDGYPSYNDYAPYYHQRNYQAREFLGMTIRDRQYNSYQFQTNLSFNSGTGIRLILRYTGTWDMYNPFDDVYSWEYRYTPGTASYVEETSHLLSATFNHQLNQSTFYEVVLSRYSNEYFQVPDDPNNPGKGMYPDDFLQYDQWEFYYDVNSNGRYDAPEPFINVNGDTVMFQGGDQYTQGDVLGGLYDYYYEWFNVAEWWNAFGDEFYRRFRETPWPEIQVIFDTMYWDWDRDGIIDNADGEPFVDLNGNGKWDGGDILIWDTNGNGKFDEERAMNINVDETEPY